MNIFNKIVEEAGKVVEEVAEGAGRVVEEAGRAVEEVVEGAGRVVEEAGRAVEEVVEGAGRAVEDVVEGARRVVEGAGRAVEDVVEGAGRAVEDVVEGARKVVEGAGKVINMPSETFKREGIIAEEKRRLSELEKSSDNSFPGYDHKAADRKNWIFDLNPKKVYLNKIVWPGTHDSATNNIGSKIIIRGLGQCQYMSIYEQLVMGTRLLDIRVNKDRNICHGILVSYGLDIVISDVKKFISETKSEIIILEIRTEHGHTDPPEFENYLKQQLGDYLIRQDDDVFQKTVDEILPKRIICIWKPKNSNQPRPGSLLWSSGYLRGNWTDTDLPATKFESNMNYLSQQPPVSSRKYFYRVEHTLTAQMDTFFMNVKPVSERILPFRRLFIAQCFSKNIADRLQVFSTDFINEDFVDICIGLTLARIQGRA